MTAPRMTVLAVGATGSIGRFVVAEALRQGHDVRALVRDRAKPRRLPREAQVVVGNLTGALLRRLSEHVRACLAPAGHLVLSGFTEDERPALEHAFAPLVVVRTEQEHAWLALTLSAPQPAQDGEGRERR